MAYKLIVNIPELPKGKKITIPGVGAFENGSTTYISTEQAEAFRHTYSFLSDSEKGPTLLKASQSMHGIEVQTTSKNAKGE